MLSASQIFNLDKNDAVSITQVSKKLHLKYIFKVANLSQCKIVKYLLINVHVQDIVL